MDTLRDATRSRHAQLSASPAMSRLFDVGYNVAEYRSHLGRLLGFFEPLERAVACGADVAGSIPAFERSSALHKDLNTMGATPSDIAALERCRWVPSIDPASLYGYTYVILGSMMGGKIIVKRLRSVLGPTASFHFYGNGNGRPEALWTSFCLDLEKNGKHNVEAICAAAVGIFDAYAAWLSEPSLQSGNY